MHWADNTDKRTDNDTQFVLMEDNTFNLSAPNSTKWLVSIVKKLTE